MLNPLIDLNIVNKGFNKKSNLSIKFATPLQKFISLSYHELN